MNPNERILLWSSNIWMLGEGLFGPLFAVYAEIIGGDIFDISWIFALYMLTTGVGMILVGIVADRYIDPKKLMIAGYFVNFLGAVTYIFVDSLAVLIFAQLLFAIGLSLSTPTWAALYDKYSGDGKGDGTAWGLYRGMGFIIGAGSMILGGLIVTYFGFQTLFMSMSLIYLLSCLYTLQVMKFE